MEEWERRRQHEQIPGLTDKVKEAYTNHAPVLYLKRGGISNWQVTS